MANLRAIASSPNTYRTALTSSVVADTTTLAAAIGSDAVLVVVDPTKITSTNELAKALEQARNRLVQDHRGGNFE